MAKSAPRRVAHVSIDAKRRRYNVREEAFARLWEYENRPRRGINYGHGILQDLMFEASPAFALYSARCRHVIRNREAAIVATVVQWLGTNVGFGFLERALKMMGKRIVDIEPEKHSPWISTDDRLPTTPGLYLVREWVAFGGRKARSYNTEVYFLVGTVPGKTGTWMRHDRARAEIALWYETEELRE